MLLPDKLISNLIVRMDKLKFLKKNLETEPPTINFEVLQLFESKLDKLILCGQVKGSVTCPDRRV